MDAGGLQIELAFCNTRDDVLGRVLPGHIQSVLFVDRGNVLSIAQRLAESVDYPAVHDFRICYISPAYRACVCRLSSLVRVEYGGIGGYFAVADRLDLDLDLIDIRICPVESLHATIIAIRSSLLKECSRRDGYLLRAWISGIIAGDKNVVRWL